MHIAGGGINLRLFTLKFLYQEHLLWRNVWSRTNDGFDLAQYLGTTVYLPPHSTYDYVFFWDSDMTDLLPQDFLRIHPAQLLATKTCRFVRNQAVAGNHKTIKVKIRPPANITSQWKFSSDWYDFPLFAWGFVLINWYEPLYRQDVGFIPFVNFPTDQLWYWSGSKYEKTIIKTFCYSPLIDSGKGNEISVYYESATATPSSDWSSSFITATFTRDLPYWLSTYGQNQSYDFSVNRKDGASNYVPWVRFYWPYLTETDITTGTITGKPWTEFVCIGSLMKKMAQIGPWVQSAIKGRVNIPFIYRSHWKWGGTMLKRQQVIGVHPPQTNQVSVKDPGVQHKSIIYPGDTKHGLLTKEALRRFLQPSGIFDERVPVPWEKQPERYADSSSYDETGSEAEESEEEPEKEPNFPAALRSIGLKLQRERAERRQLHKFLKSLLKQQ